VQDAGVDRNGNLYVLSDGNNDAGVYVTKITATGSVDTAWGGTKLLGTTTNSRPLGLDIGDDGSVFVAYYTSAWTGSGTSATIEVAKFRPNGTYDTSFGGGDGRAVIEMSGDSSNTREGAQLLSIDSEGRPVLAFQRFWGTEVVRLKSDGTIDTIFTKPSNDLGLPDNGDDPILNIAAGSYAYSSILNALLLRHQTGLGSHLDVSMLESMVEWMSFPLYYAIDGQTPPPRAGAAHATIYPYGPFPVGDGSNVMLGLQNEREWQVFCDKVLGQPDLATNPQYDSNPKRVANREHLRGLIVGAFSKMSIDEVVQALEDAQIANARVNEMKDVWSHPQLQARGRWTQVQSPVGALPALLPPATSNQFDARMDAIPAIGQHTLAILKQLGVTDEVIATLQADKAI
jgi:hypothetical protein